MPNVQTAYASWAPTYDSMENPTRDLDRLATAASLGGLRCRSILELGCGTGKNTELLAAIGGRVQALDFTPEMMALARARVPALHVTFTQADITQPWPCAAASVDLIASNLVLEHIADLDFIFAEAARCLAPDGRFFISELHPFKQYLGRKATFVVGDETVEIDAFVHAVSDFLDAGRRHGFTLDKFTEWWRQPDHSQPPLLATFMFVKAEREM